MAAMNLNTLSSVLAIPVYIDPEDIQVGQAVFHNFVHDEFEQEGMSDETVIDSANDIVAMVHQNLGANMVINNIGRNIRDLANEFAESRQREQIRMHANEVDLHHITFERFWGLLEEVFRHGINVYNIVALFFFCSDVLIRTVKQEMVNLGINLFKWSLQYIAEQVCRWVSECGGWEKALKSLIYKWYVACGAVAVIICAFGYGLYKGWKD